MTQNAKITRCKCRSLVERCRSAVIALREDIAASRANGCKMVRADFECEECGGEYTIGVRPNKGIAETQDIVV